VKQSDRLKAAHSREENIHDHKIESGVVERGEAAGVHCRRWTRETIMLEPKANCLADMRIIIHNQYAAHSGLPLFPALP